MRIPPTSPTSSAQSADIQTKAQGDDVFGNMLSEATEATPPTNTPSQSATADNATAPRISKEASTGPDQPSSGNPLGSAQRASDAAALADNCDATGMHKVQNLHPPQAVLPSMEISANLPDESADNFGTTARTSARGAQNLRTSLDTKQEKNAGEAPSTCSPEQSILAALPLIPNLPGNAIPGPGSVRSSGARANLSPTGMAGPQSDSGSQTHDSGAAAKEPATTPKPQLENAAGDSARAGNISDNPENAPVSASQGKIDALASSITIPATSPLPPPSSAAHPEVDTKSSSGDNTETNANTSTISSKADKPTADANSVVSTASSSPTSAPAHGQASTAQPVSVQAKGLDTSPAQMPTIHGISDNSSSRSAGETRSTGVHTTEANTEDLPHPSEPAGANAAYGVNSARLIQEMGQAEMQVGIRSTEFGEISIRASISQQQMLAQISVNHSELSQAMMAHLASVQTKIGNDYGLQTSISVHHQGTATAGDGGQNSQREQQAWTRQNRTFNQSQQHLPEAPVQPLPSATVDAAYRLDIQA